VRVGQSRRRDANERAIIDALEQAGAAVFQLSGPGVPDLLVAFRGLWIPLEVKSKAGKLTPKQADSRFRAGPFVIARTVDEALRAIGVR
jgi:Holliday junction resolvase